MAGNMTVVYLTKNEIAERLRCTPRNIENWMKRGLPHVPFGTRKTLFVAADVDAFMAGLPGTAKPTTTAKSESAPPQKWQVGQAKVSNVDRNVFGFDSEAGAA